MDATMNSQKYRPQKQHYYETEECSNQSECPIYGEWLAWSECSRTCGAGIRTRQTGAVDANSVADDFRLYETGTCNNEDCPEFSEWSECSGNCEDEDGTHSRVNLSTGDIETEPCNRIRCPTWSGWSAWGNCESGTTTRQRNCLNFDSANNPEDYCQSNNSESTACSEDTCAV